jgi:hypothetical protein
MDLRIDPFAGGDGGVAACSLPVLGLDDATLVKRLGVLWVELDRLSEVGDRLGTVDGAEINLAAIEIGALQIGLLADCGVYIGQRRCNIVLARLKPPNNARGRVSKHAFG